MWLPFKGGVYFIGKLTDINDAWKEVRIRAIQRRLLDAGSSTRNLSVLLSAMKKSFTTRTALKSVSLVTVVRIIRIRVRVPHVAAANIRWRGLNSLQRMI